MPPASGARDRCVVYTHCDRHAPTKKRRSRSCPFAVDGPNARFARRAAWSLARATLCWRSSSRSSAASRSRSVPVARPTCSRRLGRLPSIVCSSASSAARSSVVGRHRLVGQHGAALRRHLGDAADDEDALGDDAVLVDVDRARADRRDQRRMPRQHAEIALGAGHHHHLDHRSRASRRSGVTSSNWTRSAISC